ncbi:hypothetical protein SSX86_018192 [Deinandra increscens subsp. villosa]|uniref:Uncharacterized protein n=1 Tax=Deinandra increscens subsp. villosa TaxID=3103831 RepID=A0AAP0CVH7_9ASTR
MSSRLHNPFLGGPFLCTFKQKDTKLVKSKPPRKACVPHAKKHDWISHGIRFCGENVEILWKNIGSRSGFVVKSVKEPFARNKTLVRSLSTVWGEGLLVFRCSVFFAVISGVCLLLWYGQLKAKTLVESKLLPSVCTALSDYIQRDLHFGKVRSISPLGITLESCAIGPHKEEFSCAEVPTLKLRVQPFSSLRRGKIVIDAVLCNPTLLVAQKRNYSWLGIPFSDGGILQKHLSTEEGIDNRTKTRRIAREETAARMDRGRDDAALESAKTGYIISSNEIQGEDGRAGAVRKNAFLMDEKLRWQDHHCMDAGVEYDMKHADLEKSFGVNIPIAGVKFWSPGGSLNGPSCYHVYFLVFLSFFLLFCVQKMKTWKQSRSSAQLSKVQLTERTGAWEICGANGEKVAGIEKMVPLTLDSVFNFEGGTLLLLAYGDNEPRRFDIKWMAPKAEGSFGDARGDMIISHEFITISSSSVAFELFTKVEASYPYENSLNRKELAVVIEGVELDLPFTPDESLAVEVIGPLQSIAEENMIGTKLSFSLLKGQLRANASYQPLQSVNLEVRNLPLDELELASLRGMLQRAEVQINFQKRRGHGILSLLHPKFSGVLGEALDVAARWSGDVITVEKAVLKQSNSQYELQGEYVLPGSRDGEKERRRGSDIGSVISSMGRWRMRLEVPHAEIAEMLPLARLVSRTTDPALQFRSKDLFMQNIQSVGIDAESLQKLLEEIRGHSSPTDEVILEELSLPGLAELKGRWCGSLDASGGGNGDTLADFDFQGEEWEWGAYKTQRVLAAGAYSNDDGLRLEKMFIQRDNATIHADGTLLGPKTNLHFAVLNFPVSLVPTLVQVLESPANEAAVHSLRQLLAPKISSGDQEGPFFSR